MMMDKPISLSVNDRIEGKITITRNRVWRRHLRVCISFYHISDGAQSNVSLTVQVWVLYYYNGCLLRNIEKSSNYGDDITVCKQRADKLTHKIVLFIGYVCEIMFVG